MIVPSQAQPGASPPLRCSNKHYSSSTQQRLQLTAGSQVEEYGAQPPIELLRQFMDHEGWYDRKELTFRKMVDTQFVAAMGPPGGGRNSVTNRYLRHFSIVSMTAFDNDNLSTIFHTLVDWWLRCALPARAGAWASSLQPCGVLIGGVLCLFCRSLHITTCHASSGSSRMSTVPS
jgi:hypothetical protein